MKFDLDSKIEINKERLKHDFENLRNIQNSYGYIVVYLSFIGLTFFDFVSFLKEIDYCNLNTMIVLFMISLAISIFFIIYALRMFYKLFIPREVAHDKLPKFLYTRMLEEVTIWAEKNNKNPEEETKKAYIDLLEKAVENNFNLYIKKRLLIYSTIKIALLSLIPYFTSMVLFNLLN